MENRIADLERLVDLLVKGLQVQSIEIAAAKAFITSLAKTQDGNDSLIPHLANARLEMEAVMLNRDQEDDALERLQACFDSYLPADLLQKVIAFGDFDPKP